MAITKTIFLKGLLGAIVCLGSASAAIANKGKIVSYFSKDKGKKDNDAGVKDKNAESTTSSKTTTENSPNAVNGEQGVSGPAETPSGAGANTEQSQQVKTNPGSGADTTTGQGAGSTGGKGEGAQSSVQNGNPKTAVDQTNTDNAEINKKIGDLKLPDSCKFDGNEKDNTKECVVKKEELAKVSFVNKDDSKDLTIDGDFTNLNIEIKRFDDPKEEDKKRYESGVKKNDLWFTFKNLTTDITIKGKSSQDITLKKGTSPEFSIYSGKLTKAWYPSSLGLKVGLKCEDSSTTECTLLAATNSSKTINFFSDDSSEIKKISVGDSDKNKKITLAKDQENYNQGFKFTVPEGGISASSGSESLKAGDYEIKYLDNKDWGLAKKENAQAQ